MPIGVRGVACWSSARLDPPNGNASAKRAFQAAQRADIRPVFRDRVLAKVMQTAARVALREVAPPFTRLWWLLLGKADPNDWRLVRENAAGIGDLP